MWGFLGGKFGGDKWGFLIDRVGIFSQDLPATLAKVRFVKAKVKYTIELRVI